MEPAPYAKTMKCAEHQQEAIGVCVHCGRAMCELCSKPGNGQRFVCSPACAEAMALSEEATAMLLRKSRQSAQASAFYSYLCGLLSAAGAIGAWFYLPVPFLVWFTAGCSVVFMASGVWYSVIAGRQKTR